MAVQSRSIHIELGLIRSADVSVYKRKARADARENVQSASRLLLIGTSFLLSLGASFFSLVQFFLSLGTSFE